MEMALWGKSLFLHYFIQHLIFQTFLGEWIRYDHIVSKEVYLQLHESVVCADFLLCEDASTMIRLNIRLDWAATEHQSFGAYSHAPRNKYMWYF